VKAWGAPQGIPNLRVISLRVVTQGCRPEISGGLSKQAFPSIKHERFSNSKDERFACDQANAPSNDEQIFFVRRCIQIQSETP